MKKPVVILIAAALLGLFAGGVYYQTHKGPKALQHPHLILILVDTLRADRLSCYGYARQTTPQIDKIAAQGALFEHAYSPSSWTVPAMATIFTGLFPQQHGVVQGLMIDRQVLRQHQLPYEIDTLAERLQTAGYQTFGYSTNAHITRAMGFAQGFDTFQELLFSDAEVVEALVMKDLKKFKKRDREGKPYFLYLHFVDPHWPYEARTPWLDRLAPGGNAEWREQALKFKGDPMLHFAPGYFNEHKELLRAFEDLYDSEVAATDASIGRILTALPRAGQAIVMVMADHGESFSEHDTMLHGYDLYESTVHVPLILRGPVAGADASRRGMRVKERATLADVMPTLLTAAGAEARDLPGTDLFAPPPGDRNVPLHLSRGPIAMHGAIVGHEKGIIDDRLGKSAYFDLAADPGETHNLLPGREYPPALKEEMDRAAVITPVAPQHMQGNESLADRKLLESLGYLTPGTPAEETPAPTPEPTPEVKLWVVDAGVCPYLFKIDKACGKFAGEKWTDCVAPKIEELKKTLCPQSPNFNYRKKCEFLKMAPSMQKCRMAQEMGLLKKE